MNTKSVLAISTLSALLLLSAITPVLAVTPDAALAKLGGRHWKSGTDNAGNVFTFVHTPHTHPRSGTGQIISSPYLGGIPWDTSWTQKQNNFHIVATDSNPSDPRFCSFEYFGTFSSPTTASGTWDNLPTGTNSCTATGTFTMTSGGAAVITTTGGRPGVA